MALLLDQITAASSSSLDRFTRRQHRQRSLVMFGTMDSWLQRQQQQQLHQIFLASNSNNAPLQYNNYKPPPMEDEDDDHPEVQSPEEVPATTQQTPPPPQQLDTQTTPSVPSKPPKDRIKMWPPWPFNLLQQQQRHPANAGNAHSSPFRVGPIGRVGTFVWGFFGQQARVSVKEFQDIASRFWFHLPPMTPPLLLWTLWPRQETVLAGEATKTILPLFTNPMARNLVLTGFSLAIMSWAHSELNRFRTLTPLPLNTAYRNIHTAILPHVLPEEVPEPFFFDEDDNDNNDDDDDDDQDQDQDSELPQPTPTTKSASKLTQKLSASVPPRLQQHFNKLIKNGSGSVGGGTTTAPPPKKKSWRKNMKRMRQARRSEALKVRRMAIYDELVALQAIKRKAAAAAAANPKKMLRKDEEPLGYALVTGASRGIGRAIAVELARWEIPLILVARDLPRLTSLAYDLEACYGIKCCVLQADLSNPHAAEQIHRATQKAGLTVDILVNNAGISSTGLAVEMPIEQVDRMIRVNALAAAHLAHLYGKDMKDRRRGRILMVSSVVGAVAAGPTVALYAATKAFEKSLGLSLSKELEPYGVGVTCLMPGAVRDTDFRSSSSTHQALCWKLPGYPKAPATVASMGVQALLAGKTEVTPGWQNRVFVKVFQPFLPQRLHNILVEMAWNPPMVPTFLKLWKSPEKRQKERQSQLEGRRNQHADLLESNSVRRSRSSAQEWRPRSNMNLPPPLLLTVPEETPASTAAPKQEPVPEVPKSALVGPEPVVESLEPLVLSDQEANSNQTSVTNSRANEDVDDDSSFPDGTSMDNPYDTLREKLPTNLENPAAESPTEASPSAGPQPAATSLGSQQPQQLFNEYERQVRELQQQSQIFREHILKLQQQLHEQEREQFQQKRDLERQQQEMEYQKHEMEEERARREQESRDRPTERQNRWRKRPTQRTETLPEYSEDVPPTPKVVRPTPGPRKRPISPTKPNLMDESLNHPLLSR